MKKIFIFYIAFMVIALLIGCQKKVEFGGEEKINIETKMNNSVKFETGTYPRKNWEEPIGTYKNAVIPNKDVALQMATMIFESMERSTTTQKYIADSVFYDEEDEFWVVHFGISTQELEDGTAIAGGGCCIALQEKDGKVLRIWFEE